MGIVWNEISEKSKGGTEILGRKLEGLIDPKLMDEFQIFPSRVRAELDPGKLRIFWAHDMPDDPESAHLADGGWAKYHRLVFVSHWQMQAYIAKFSIPWSRCQVIQNAIDPLTPNPNKNSETIRLVYHSTPHRGLNILAPVFDKLCEMHQDIHLDVFSSFKLYGWEDSDKSFKPLFDMLGKNPQITNHGAVSNEEVRAALSNAHIFAYPSTWQETSCLCLMEAMSAGLMCVHPSYGALPETAANWTMQYQWDEDPHRHAGIFYQSLDTAIRFMREKQERTIGQLASQRSYANVFYSWDLRKMQWEGFLTSLLHEPREVEKPKQFFTYRA
jgi:UDP-glucose:(glucosyl)LPS alpha-1,2-glucosyltransferase